MAKYPSVLSVIAGTLLLLTGCTQESTESTLSLSVAGLLGSEPAPGFRHADRTRMFRFPEDHGPHPEYRTEWWYFTGNLEDQKARRYGFQLTLFRNAIQPTKTASPSRWRTNQIFMGHLAITDGSRQSFTAVERFAREALDLAGAQTQPVRVWLEDWTVERLEGDDEVWMVQAATENHGIRLRLDATDPIVLQGDRGLSRKSTVSDSASYYYSLPRMRAQGTLTSDGTPHEVTGSVWLDREWSTSQLGPDQAGWDWFALQLDDGAELMFYRLRNKDGETDPASGGVYLDSAGGRLDLGASGVTLQETGVWRSPRGTRYPSGWTLELRHGGQRFRIEPLIKNQELDLSVRYWEGAVTVFGADGHEIGVGYVELTGYDEYPIL